MSTSKENSFPEFSFFIGVLNGSQIYFINRTFELFSKGPFSEISMASAHYVPAYCNFLSVLLATGLQMAHCDCSRHPLGNSEIFEKDFRIARRVQVPKRV